MATVHSTATVPTTAAAPATVAVETIDAKGVAKQTDPKAKEPPYAIVGLQTGFNGAIPPPRREIRDLYTNYPEQFNLFLLGLRALQDTDFSKRCSYFQIAGIHGVPWQDWDQVDGRVRPFYDAKRQPQKPDSNGGYCVHDSVLFPTWHRPYVMLIEQVLGGIIAEIAQTFRQDLRPKYVEAAKLWRFPYWDYLRQVDAGQCTLPAVVSGYDPTDHTFNHTRIEVLKPSGKIEVISNPLYAFEFDKPGFKREPYMSIMGPGSPATCTRRGSALQEAADRSNEKVPDLYKAQNKPPDPSCNADVARGYNKQVKKFNQQRNLVRLLKDCDIYDAYASKGWGAFYGSNNRVNTDHDYVVSPSIEKLHDIVHTGGGGNLKNIQEASFDPLFWLHHCNIDRWQAFWETLHPATKFIPTRQDIDTYFQAFGDHPAGQVAPPDPKTASSYTLEGGVTVDETTPLMPFHKSTTRDDFWTSADCRKLHSTMGYTYPEFLDQHTYKTTAGLPDEPAFRAALSQTVDNLYGYNAQGFDDEGYPLELKQGVLTRVPIKEFGPDPMRPLKAPAAMMKDAGLATLEPAKLESVKVNLKPPSSPRNYFITWGVQHYALQGNFLIYFYLGKIPDALNAKFSAKNAIGNMVVLANDPEFIKGCYNCQDIVAKSLMVWDAADITLGLITATDAKQRPAEMPALAGLDEAHVVPYLAANLNWCIIKMEGNNHTVVPLTDPGLASMVVTVRSEAVATGTKGAPVPSIMKYATHIEATKGKPGGFTGTLPAATTAALANDHAATAGAGTPATGSGAAASGSSAPHQASSTPAPASGTAAPHQVGTTAANVSGAAPPHQASGTPVAGSGATATHQATGAPAGNTTVKK